MSSALRVGLYDRLVALESLQTLWQFDAAQMAGQVLPRRSQFRVPSTKPFLVYGLGNATNEDLAEDTDHQAERQFFQLWIHDVEGSYQKIDDTIPLLIRGLVNWSYPPASLTGVRYLETSSEFNNETYKTIFRYIRFQAIISSGERIAS